MRTSRLFLLACAVALPMMLVACAPTDSPASNSAASSTSETPETSPPAAPSSEPSETVSAEPDWVTFVDPVGAITQAEANSGWDGHSLVQGPPYDIRGLDMRCYRYDHSFDLVSFGTWVYQGTVSIDAEGTYHWLEQFGGTVAPSGIGAQLVFTGAWDNPGNAYIAIPDDDGDPRLIAALAVDDYDVVLWYCYP